MKKQIFKGFTLIELLVVIGIIARNTQRWANVNSLLNAVGQRLADNKGVFEANCAAGEIPTLSATPMASTGYNIAECIIPTYISTLPVDPSAAGAHYTNNSDYDTGYTIQKDATTGRIIVSAPGTEIPPESAIISVTR
jgi:prepilin-type N-terminal cleavage/methylation domain-containing protein